MSNLTPESANKKKGLGRGLGSLLGGDSPTMQSDTQTTNRPQMTTHLNTQVAAPSGVSAPTVQANQVNTEGKVWQVAIDKLVSGEYQPRQNFKKESLQDLAQSIKENGILQPIIARKSGSGRLEIVAGERRWRAAQAAGLHEVPVLIKNFNDQETLELAIIENIQREDLNPIEEAEGYARLIGEFKLSQQQVSEKVGRDRATVANAVRLLALPEEVKGLVGSGQLSVGHAKVLLSLPDIKTQIVLAKKVLAEKISVRKLEKLVSEAQAPQTEKAPLDEKSVTQRLIAGLSDELQKIIGTKVAIDYGNSKGRISVHFYSDDELTQIVEKLKQGWSK